MKYLAAILAGSVVNALAFYLLFDWLGAFELLGARVTVNVSVFVLFLAVLATGAGALSTLILRMLDHAEHKRFAALEARVQQLERKASSVMQVPGS